MSENIHKHQIGDTITVMLKTLDEIKKSYKWNGRCFQHPSGGMNATLTVYPGAKKLFGTQVNVKLKYIKHNRTIWQFNYDKFASQMIYGDWFTESIFNEELFEI